MRHDEVSGPEQIYFFLRKWHRHHGEWAKIVLESAEEMPTISTSSCSSWSAPSISVFTILGAICGRWVLKLANRAILNSFSWS
jgi:hypothetical protein